MVKQTSSHKKKEIIEAKCGNCEEKVKSNQKFCPNCGAELDWDTADDEPEEKPAAKATSAEPKALTKAEKEEMLIQDAKNKIKRWSIALVICILIVFAVGSSGTESEAFNSIATFLLAACVFFIFDIIRGFIYISKHKKNK